MRAGPWGAAGRHQRRAAVHGPDRGDGRRGSLDGLGFRQVMRPILLSPEQGADTIVWLATAPQVSLGSGRFWHDRRARPEYPLPWTRETGPSTARKLWDHLVAATATDSPEAGAGRAGQRGCCLVISPRGQG